MPVVLLLLALVASACLRPPAQLAGTYPPTTVREAQGGGHVGERVRWGGTVVSTTPQRERTCIEVVSLPLDRQARPEWSDATSGRFIACAPGFYDPAVYARDREVTVVGTLGQPTTGTVGDFEYPFPRIDAETVYLWPKREPVYYDPYWNGGWAPGWGWGFGVGWGGRVR